MPSRGDQCNKNKIAISIVANGHPVLNLQVSIPSLLCATGTVNTTALATIPKETPHEFIRFLLPLKQWLSLKKPVLLVKPTGKPNLLPTVNRT